MADFSLTAGKSRNFVSAVTKAGDPTAVVDVTGISWVAGTGEIQLVGATDALSVTVLGVRAGVTTLVFAATRVSDALAISKAVTVEVVEVVEPAPDVTITAGEEF